MLGAPAEYIDWCRTDFMIRPKSCTFLPAVSTYYVGICRISERRIPPFDNVTFGRYLLGYGSRGSIIQALLVDRNERLMRV